jgi:soluble lytic murein transglycosylase-like protein
MLIQRILRRAATGPRRHFTTRMILFATVAASLAAVVPSTGTPVEATGLSASATPASRVDTPQDQGAVAPAPAAPPVAPTPVPPPPWADGLPPAGVAWALQIQDAATKAGLDPLLLASLVWVESSFDPAAVSPVGALGLAQVMPATAAELGIDPHNAEQNLAGGARYLKDNLDRFGRTDLALAAYNAGPGRVAEVRAIPAIRETQDYVARVLAVYLHLRA